jgi:predicted DNA-binding protein
MIVLNKRPKETASTTIRLPKEWKELIKLYQEDSEGISSSSRTMSAYIIQAIKEKMIKDNII